MLHPHQQAAATALNELQAALNALRNRMQRERYGWTVVDDGLRSWAPGIGGGGGSGHGDPIGAAIAGSVSTRAARRARWTADTLTWLCRRLQLSGDPLNALEVAIPRLCPSTAGQLTLWLEELHGRVCATLEGRDT